MLAFQLISLKLSKGPAKSPYRELDKPDRGCRMAMLTLCLAIVLRSMAT